MNMRQNLMDIYKILTTDETLLRLLYYSSTGLSDSPLTVSVSKPNILSKPAEEKWGIINDRIKSTIKTDDLDEVAKCRICFYAGQRKSTRNYLIAEQCVYVDIIVHLSFENVDFRLSWICDRINELFLQMNQVGMGKVIFRDGGIVQAPSGYCQYRLIFSFGSFTE